MARKFDPKLSMKLDRATTGAERGNVIWRIIKRAIEWYIWKQP